MFIIKSILFIFCLTAFLFAVALFKLFNSFNNTTRKFKQNYNGGYHKNRKQKQNNRENKIIFTHKNNSGQKIFTKNEDEYVDFEEVH